VKGTVAISCAPFLVVQKTSADFPLDVASEYRK